MTKDDVMQALLREYPNGVSFDPMALRLVQQKIQLEDSQIECLKADMFRMEEGLWFSRKMIAGDDTLMAIDEQVDEWLTMYGCFSVEKLLGLFSADLRHIATPKDLSAFLQYQGHAVATWGVSGMFCYRSSHSLDDHLAELAEAINERLAEASGTIPLHQLEETMPHFSIEAFNGVRISFLPEVYEIDIAGVLCWQSEEVMHLPENFSNQLTSIVDVLVMLGERISVRNLEFALNLSYQIHFREEYSLQNKRAFMRVCANHYHGRNYVFPSTMPRQVQTYDLSKAGRRKRRPNTRFEALGVPVGAKLVFTKDNNTTCTVLNGSNKVEFKGEAIAISKLAIRLLDVSVANGFNHFSYEGENLWKRRERLERKSCASVGKVAGPAERHEPDQDIIGLQGGVLSPSTWRSYRANGTNPRVAEWVQRIDSGEEIEQIAEETGYAVTTVELMICNHRLYYEVCELNSITPETGADV